MNTISSSKPTAQTQTTDPSQSSGAASAISEIVANANAVQSLKALVNTTLADTSPDSTPAASPLVINLSSLGTTGGTSATPLQSTPTQGEGTTNPMAASAALLAQLVNLSPGAGSNGTPASLTSLTPTASKSSTPLPATASSPIAGTATPAAGSTSGNTVAPVVQVVLVPAATSVPNQTTPTTPSAAALLADSLVQSKSGSQSPSQQSDTNSSSDNSSGGGNLGNAILQSIAQQSAQAATANSSAAPSTSGADRVNQIESLMNEMADRVLVTDPLHAQSSQVSVKLADNIMPNTEVTVSRLDGGGLSVSFNTPNADWASVLNQIAPQLAQQLNERLQLAEPAIVTVQMQNSGGTPSDGRSRQRNTTQDQARNYQ